MNDYMSKPFTLEGIQNMLIKWASFIENRNPAKVRVNKNS